MWWSEDDNWIHNWFRCRRYPFVARSIFDELEEQFREMHEYMQREFEELSKKAPKDLVRTKVLPDGSKVEEWGPFVYGYTIKIGPQGKPEIREFGNIKPQPKLGSRSTVDVRKEREPLVDVVLMAGEVKVVAELPGVDKKDIQLSGTEDTLTISVDAGERSYFKEIELPTKVEVRNAKSTYKNGVLEVTLPAKKVDEPKGQPIKID
ncbi:MAG: Hsp20/alpha crystallin family protein [Candidatus Bathyarchaeota archaeon]|nr:Hsp20/alpha crystallin family protein [Candidatus Bathyarchaeota archaeon]